MTAKLMHQPKLTQMSQHLTTSTTVKNGITNKRKKFVTPDMTGDVTAAGRKVLWGFPSDLNALDVGKVVEHRASVCEASQCSGSVSGNQLLITCNADRRRTVMLARHGATDTGIAKLCTRP